MQAEPVTLPPLDASEWRETGREDRPPAERGGVAYSYVTYERNGAGGPADPDT
jgi:hypothetical protein